MNNSPDNPNLKNPSTPAYSKEQEHFLELTFSVFKINREGREWLEIMKDSLVDKLPVADPSKDSHHAFYREGQNSMIRAILQNIRLQEEQTKKNNRTGDEC